MAKLFLKHITGYSYTDNVSESTNRIMLFPYNDTNQHLVNHNISITGNPELFTYIDHFNNGVGVFNFLDPHSSLIIKSCLKDLAPLIGSTIAQFLMDIIIFHSIKYS